MFLVGQILFKPQRDNVSDFYRDVDWFACFSSWEGVLGLFDKRSASPDQYIVIRVPVSCVGDMLSFGVYEDDD